MNLKDDRRIQRGAKGIWSALGFGLLGVCILGGLLPAEVAGAATSAPVWNVSVTSQPTNLSSSGGQQGFLIVATNVGSADTEGEINLTDTLPTGLSSAGNECEAAGQLVRCTSGKVVHPGGQIVEFIPVDVAQAASGSVVENVVSLEGGGAGAVVTSTQTEVDAPLSPSIFLAGSAGIAALVSESNDAEVVRAGATPYQLTINLGFPTELFGQNLNNLEHPRDISVDLPPGIAFDSSAIPRCHEVQLEQAMCPPASQMGSVSVAVTRTPIIVELEPLYNMVPPPGSVSNFAFSAAGLGVDVHLLGSLRTGDYGPTAMTGDILAKNAILGMQLQLWGNPSDPSHAAARGASVQPAARPLITMPSACGPLGLTAKADSWEHPGSFVARSVSIQDGVGDPLEIEGCSGLGFEPDLSVRPSTAMTDSPSGLKLRIEVPQRLDSRGFSTASLRGAKVTLPPGMLINPSVAGGLAICTPAEIGLVTEPSQSPPRFNGSAATCPDASRLGTVEALSPILSDESEDGQPASHPVTGSIYLGESGQDSPGSPFALYVAVEDPGTGVVIKLASEVEANPLTGQLTAVLDEIPQLPLEDLTLTFFEGPRAPMRTPAICGSSTARAELNPWSGTASTPVGSSFVMTESPGGGSCATAQAQLPNVPRFNAGTVLPTAGRHSPFVLDISRGDGSQEFGGLDLTLPPGLTGRLAGSTYCSDAALAASAAQNGTGEQANPSCPVASRIGHGVVSVGAGSSPYQAEGSVYLAGPYREAPLSLALVTPAVAGPFDLGTVVVRAAVFVDPTTGALNVKTDSLPTILDGIPLDVRSVQVEIDKPDLISSPTSCQPMAITGSETSTIGQVAPLFARFQVGKCGALAFKPKLSLQLSGALERSGHPTLRAVLRTDPEGAALKSTSFGLPAGELLDLEHIRALCPGDVPAESCPATSRLGSARLYSPLLESPLEGSVYLRAPKRRLPEIVGEVHSQGLTFRLRGRVTASKGRLGVKLGPLPDVPLSRAILSLSGGRRGIVVNSRSLCGRKSYGVATFDAHNGMTRRLRVPVRAGDCS